MAAMLDDITKEAKEECLVNIIKHGGDDVSCEQKNYKQN
jgi:hypothetical protein